MSLRIFFTLILLALTLFVVFSKLDLFKQISFENTGTSTYPDAYVENLIATQMDEEGLPKERLETRELLHYPSNNSLRLSEPLLTFYQKAAPPWNVSALIGVFYPDLNQIDLTDHVKAYQAAGPKNPATTLLTHQATVYTDTEKIIADGEVTVERPGFKLRSLGVHANLKKEEIVLSSQAEAFYKTEPNSPPPVKVSTT